METKISLIGVGSASFGLKSLFDISCSPQLRGSKVALTDVDESRLALMKNVAISLNEYFKAGLSIEATSSLKKALTDSEFVMIAADREYMKRWKMNFEIPFRHGIKQVIGSCGGPGGLAHSLITIPMILEICKKIEDNCKDAIVLNYTNPESKVVHAISKFTKLKAYGLCPGIYERLEAFGELFGVLPEEFTPFAAGLNHFTWLMDIRFKNGKQVYPLLDEKLKAAPDFEPLSRELYRTFGYYPSPGDTLTGEFVPYAWDMIPDAKRGMNHIRAIEERGARIQKTVLSIAGGEAPPEHMSEIAKSAGVRIINAILEGGEHYELSVNIPNGGCISNIPSDVVVEIPAKIDEAGIHGVSVGSLPRGIAAMCNNQGSIQTLAVEAAKEGSYEKALQAMVLDPVVSTPSQARETLDDLLRSHASVLPQFS